jgi:hypothetical protein
MKTTLATLMAFACFGCACAQTPPGVEPTHSSIVLTPQSPAPAAALAAPAPPSLSTESTSSHNCRILVDTPVVVEIAEPLDTAKLHTGDFFAVRLAEPVNIADGGVIPIGTPGVGQVVDVAAPRAGGAPAKLVLAARHLDFAGQQLKLHALKISTTGKDRTTLAMGLSFGVGALAMFVHGGQILIPAGTHADAKLAPNDPLAQGPDAAASVAPPAQPTSLAHPPISHLEH